jgi:methyltransferase-like protein/SAM-dependent methyltransferase
MTSNTLTSYDLIPYPNYSFPQTHPDRAAVIATLLGLSPVPVQNCRVLELGCAAGSNLIPMAEDLPHSAFVGIDLSQRQIDEGIKEIAELGLSNIELRRQSILDFEPGSQFDYILCHGVFSWVPPNVQERILAICRDCLTANGIAYVSYNTLPGWHMRGMIRDMMLYHGRRFSDPREQISRARGLLDFLVASIPMEENPYAQFLRAELELLRRQPDSYLFHDHLEEHNSPLYFHQFVEQAASHGLRYLADVSLGTMALRNFPQQVGEALQRASTDFIQIEQYMDFLRNRSFRQTLLCRLQHTPNYHVKREALTGLFMGSSLRPLSPSPNLNPDVRETFRGPSGSTATTPYPIVKAALSVLGDIWPQFLPVEELCSQARAKLQASAIQGMATSGEDELRIKDDFLHLFMIADDLVEFRLRRLSATRQPGPLPLARPLARWQARSGRAVTNLRHESLVLDEFGREALQRLDGQHPRQAVAQELAALVAIGHLTVPQQGQMGTAPQEAGQEVLGALEQQIEQFASQALLLA